MRLKGNQVLFYLYNFLAQTFLSPSRISSLTFIVQGRIFQGLHVVLTNATEKNIGHALLKWILPHTLCNDLQPQHGHLYVETPCVEF